MEYDVVASDMHVMCEFLDVVLKDICDLPLEWEVKITMDLIHSTTPMSITLYKMPASKLVGLEIKLELRRPAWEQIR